MSKTHPPHQQNALRWTEHLVFGLAATIATTLSSLPAQAVTLNAGDILVADFEAFGGSGGVIRVDPITGVQTEVSSGQFFVDPLAITVDASGNIFVADPSALDGLGGVIRVDPTAPTTNNQTVVSFDDMFGFLTDITLEANGNILVSDSQAFGGSGGVIRVDPTTGAQMSVSSGGSFVAPNGITLDASGNIIVSNPDQSGATPDSIIRVDPITGVQTVVSSGLSFVLPSGNTVEPNGFILVADPFALGAGAVIRVDPTTGAQTTIFPGRGQPLDTPLDVTLDASGNILVADQEAFSRQLGGVISINPATGVQTEVSSGGLFVDPASITTVPVPVPWNPSSTVGLLVIGALGADKILKHKLKKQKLEH